MTTDHQAGDPAHSQTLHATTVAFDRRGILILGKSGSGKSSLALQLMAYGAGLVADDRTEITRAGTVLRARAPSSLEGLIEARGVGILHAEAVPSADLVLAIDLDTVEKRRLPPRRRMNLLGCRLALLHNPDTAAFAAAVLQYMKAGRSA